MSRELDKLAVQEAIQGKRPSSTGWIRTQCPFCYSEGLKLSVNVGGGAYDGYYQCWKPSCSKRGFVGEKNVKSTKHKVETALIELPEEFKLLTTESGGASSRMLAKFRKYLYGRGVSQDIIDETMTGAATFGRYKNFVIVPFMKKKKVVGFGARNIFEKVYRYAEGFEKEQNPFNQDALYEETDIPLVVVEGFFDAMPHWPFAMAVGGQPSAYHWEELFPKAKRPLVLAFDADMQIKNELGADLLALNGVRAKYLKLPPGTDPGGTDREKFLRKAFSLFRENFE